MKKLYSYQSIKNSNGGFSTSPSFGKYCGTTIPTNFTSHGTQMYLKFRTDDSIEEEGFHIHFDSTTEGYN